MRSFVLFILLIFLFPLHAARMPEFSTAGFFKLQDSGREVYSMNVAWRFYKGDVKDAYLRDFDDKEWPIVSLPHGIEYLPVEASGVIDYKGVVWYRKHFKIESHLREKRLFLHFEAIMGKCKIWINGKLAKEHFGGYLPIVIDATDLLLPDEENVVAVCADNSDDPSFPPGKEEDRLDFSYFGGIYRDCWLIAHNDTYITDPNYEDKEAGGGVFFSFDEVNEDEAVVNIETNIRHKGNARFNGYLEYEFINSKGERLPVYKRKVSLKPNADIEYQDKVRIEKPQLWTPENPHLYQVQVRIKDKKGAAVDGFVQKIGVRSLEFKGKDGFYLNGKAYDKPLIGANKHQDFAVIGNAVPNNLHWRDAYKLKKVGFNVIRLSHYPQDPAFMDACDELGIFVIVPTPGWQFWNPDPIFGTRVESDIRRMVRRDRNHPSILFWEPILNETGLFSDKEYDLETQSKALELVKKEYPYKSGYAGGGPKESFSILYGGVPEPDKVYFTREYGDGGSVNDWHGQNAPNRASRAWGEVPMLVQAHSYANSLESVCRGFYSSKQHLGGAVWHSFDTQRGYHPDPFYGGIMDAFRLPKYAYYMYMSQRDPHATSDLFECGPMIYIAHEMSPFSPKDVTVFTNCDEVRLSLYKNGKVYVHKREKEEAPHIISSIITFEDIYDYEDWKEMSRSNKLEDVYMLAEGLIDGKVVARHMVRPANRAVKINLTLDNENTALIADGSDMVTVVASVVDDMGNVKRLNNQHIRFQIEGEGRLVGDETCFANPKAVVWGEAPILVQSTTTPGEIKIIASVCFEGVRTPVKGELIIKSVSPQIPLLYDKKELSMGSGKKPSSAYSNRQQKKSDAQDLDDVYQQQNHFMQK